MSGNAVDKQNSMEDLSFIDESSDVTPEHKDLPPWKIIIADDQEEVHNVTKLVLDDFSFKGRRLIFLDAFSGQETKEIIRNNPDVAFILLDVVMETDDAGLEVVRFIRETLQNNIVQIVLNTGQPGQAPEQEVISKYEINDYKSKTELNAQKLITSTTASLRAYSLSYSLNDANTKLNEYRNHLEELVKARTAELEKANTKLELEIEERRRAEKALQHEHKILENILAASPIGICLVENKTIQWINGEMYKLFGFDGNQDFKGKSTEFIYETEAEYQRVDKIIIEKLQQSSPVVVDATFQRKDGSCFPGNIKISSSEQSDPMRQAVMTISDITWRKQAEHDRMLRERLQGALEVSGSICHELNQPLQYISGSTELIMMDMPEDDPLYIMISKIKEQIDRMGKITRKLMGITSYKTRDYVGGKKILDLDAASKNT